MMKAVMVAAAGSVAANKSATDPTRSVLRKPSRHRVVSRLVPRATVAAAISATLLGCGDLVRNAALRRVLSDNNSWLMVAGELEDTAAALGIVIAARIMEDSGVAVLDATEPHLKVFDSSGRLRWSALRTGPGPREIVDPAALTELRAGRLVVFDGAGNARLFSRDGAYLGSQKFGDVRTLAATRTCGDSIVIYGYQHRSPGSGWLHLFTMVHDSLAYKRTLYTDSVRSPHAVGLAYGLSSIRTGVIVRHPYSIGHVLRWRCGEVNAEAYRASSRVVVEVPTGSTRVIRPGMQRAIAGLIFIDSTAFEINAVYAARAGNIATEFVESDSLSERHWRVPKLYSLS
ncbi:MAG: hypothetical protein ACREMA_07035 [Longimicrobiales bacterium]